MLSLSAKSFAIQIGNVRIEHISSKVVLIHMVPVFTFLIIAYLLIQILTGGTRRIQVRDKRMIIRRKSFFTRIRFITLASIVAIVLAVLYPMAASFGVPGTIIESLLAAPLIIFWFLRWLFVVNAYVTLDRTATGSLLRGRRNIALECWKGVGVEQRFKSKARGASLQEYGVYLIPAENAGGSLGGPAFIASWGTLATFRKESYALDMAAEVAQFSGLPLISSTAETTYLKSEAPYAG